MSQHTGVRAALRGCRIVTTSMTARLLLANQLRVLDDVSWSVISGDPYEDAPPGLDVEVVPMHREFSPSDLSAFVRLWRTLRRRRFDFVQTHTPKASFLGLPAARLSGTTGIYTVHGALWFRDNTRARNLLGWLFETWCCRWADLVVVQSREDHATMVRARIVPARKVRYVGNGIVLERFLCPVEPAELPVAPSSAPGSPVVLMVSRLVREKGCSDFLALARALAGRARFVHVGPREEDQADAITDEELAAAAGSVVFVGEVVDVRPYIAAADLVVQPSYREGIPRVVMEAGAAGRTVVAYDVRGVREVVGPDTGMLVGRGDLRALIEAVDMLLGDPERVHALGAAARTRASGAFSEEAVIERMRSLYEQIEPRS
jgi:glycosyltransferase involved in cell wall biosynthesis